jgi:DNA-binding CsgD family transcriptional regulator/PAS domain-containing protein
MRCSLDFDELIGRIYDTAIDPQTWPATLNCIADITNANVAMIGSFNSTTREFTAISPRQDPERLEHYARHWACRNPLRQRAARVPVGVILVPEMLMPRDDYVRSDFFNEWMRPQGLEAALGTNALIEGSTLTVFALYRPLRIGEFQAHEVELFGRMIPHVQRALQLSTRIGRAETERSALIHALDRLREGVALVDASGRLLYVNRTGEDIFAEGAGLSISSMGLQTATAGDSAILRRLIARCVSGSAGGTIRLSRGKQRAQLSVLVTPMPRCAPWADGIRPAAILLITDPDRNLRINGDVLQRNYGLTQAEVALALEILQGDGLSAAARRLGVCVTTARTHLAHVLDKTGTHRQAELVRMFLQGQSALAED